MFNVKSQTALWILFAIFILGGCSKNNPEDVLEAFYRTAAKADKEALVELMDLSMFSPTKGIDRMGMQYKVEEFIGMMDDYYNTNGELKKVSIKKTQEFQDDGKDVLGTTHEMIFKNGRIITNKLALTKPDGQWKVYVLNENRLMSPW